MNEYNLYQGDCLNVLPSLDNDSVDLIIIDPPYGIDFDTNRRKKKPDNVGAILNDDDFAFELMSKITPELHRILKDDSAIYCFCRWDVYPQFKEILEKQFHLKNLLIWVKNVHGMGDLEGSYATQYECIIFAVKGRHLLNDGRDPDVLFFDKVPAGGLIHSHQKPEKLIKYLINKSSKEGDTVLDCFLGSGTTFYACQNNRRSCIGVELDPKYIDIIKTRAWGRQFLDRKVKYEFMIVVDEVR